MFVYNENRGIFGPLGLRSKAALSVGIPGVPGASILGRVDAPSPGGAHATCLEISGRPIAPGWRTPCCPETKCTFVSDLARVSGRRRAARNPRGAPSLGSQLTPGLPTAASCCLGLCFPLSRILAGQERDSALRELGFRLGRVVLDSPAGETGPPGLSAIPATALLHILGAVEPPPH